MTQSTPKKTTARKRATTRKGAPRRRTGAAKETSAEQPLTAGSRPASSEYGQLVILVVALAFGLLGLLVHVLWIISIVLMGLLLGLIASDLRSRHNKGIVVGMVNEVKLVVEDIKAPAVRDEATPTEDGTSSNPSQ